MLHIRPETPADVPAREALLDRCFGPGRFAKTCERLREGRLPAEDLAFALARGRAVLGTLRFWDVEAGDGRPALLLGPVAIDPALQGVGLGSKLIGHGLARAAEAGHGAVLLIGDAPYYARFGFAADLAAGLSLPGPFERGRFLGLELRPGSLRGVAGPVVASGRVPPPSPAPFLARAA